MLKSKNNIFKYLLVVIIFCIVGIICFEYNNPKIYHAKYLDELYHKEANVFIVKNTFLNQTGCHNIEAWANKNLPNKTSDAITFISHSSEIDENYAFLKADYDKIVWSNLICEMNAQNKECYYCRE